MGRKGGSRKKPANNASGIGRFFSFTAGSHGKKAMQNFLKDNHCRYEYIDYYKCKHSVSDSSLVCLSKNEELINDEVILIALSILTDQFYNKERAYGWKGAFVIKDPLFAHRLLAITPQSSSKSFDIGKFQISYEDLAKQIGQYFGKESGWERRGWTLHDFLYDGCELNEFFFPCCIPHEHWFMIRVNLEHKRIVCSSSSYQSILYASEKLPDDFHAIKYSFDEDFLRYMKGKRKTVTELNQWCRKFNLFSEHSNIRHCLISLFMCYAMNSTASFLFDQFKDEDSVEWKFMYDPDASQCDGSNCNGGLYCIDVVDSTFRNYKGDKKYFDHINNQGRNILLNLITNPKVVNSKQVDLEKDDEDEVYLVEDSAKIMSPLRANPIRKAKVLSQELWEESPEPDLTEKLSLVKMSSLGTKLLEAMNLDYKVSARKILRSYLKEFGAYVLTNSPIASTPEKDLKIIAYLVVEHNHLREFPATDKETSHGCAIIHMHSHTTNMDYSESVFGTSNRDPVRENREKGFFEDSIPLRFLMYQAVRLIIAQKKRDNTETDALYFPVYKSTTGNQKPATRGSQNKKRKTDLIDHLDNYTLQGDVDLVVEQNLNLRKLFGFHTDRPPVNTFHTTDEYEWQYKPGIKHGGTTLLIGQTLKHVSQCTMKNLTNMEGQLKFLFQVSQEKEMSSHVMYLDPHAVTDIQFFPAEESGAEPNVFANNKWFGYRKVDEKSELQLSQNLTKTIEEMKKKTKDTNKRQWFRPEFGGAVSFISQDRSCVWLSLKSMFQRHFKHLLPMCQNLENKYGCHTFEDLCFFKAKVKGKDIPLSELLKEMSIQVVKVKPPDDVDIFSFLDKGLKENKCYLCILSNIHGESIHAIGIETFDRKIVLNDSGTIHEYDGKGSLSKCLGNVPCIGVKLLCHLNIK